MDTDKLMQRLPIILPACAAAISSIYYLSKSKEEKNGLREVPYPSGLINWPLFGHMFAFGPVPAKQIVKWHKEKGPIFKLEIGCQTWMFIGDPYLAHKIFVKAGSKTSSRPYHRFLVDIHGLDNKGIIFSRYNEVWKNKRKAANALLSPSSIEKYGEVLEAEADALMDRFEEHLGEEVDPILDLQLTTMNVILTVAAALRCESKDDPTFIALSDLLTFGKTYGGPMGDIVSLLPSLKWLDKLVGMEDKLRTFVTTHRDPLHGKIIQDALLKEEPSLVKELYKLKDEGILDEKEILVSIGDMIAAGTDTSAVSIYWGFAVLSQMPGVQAKISQEIDEWKAKREPGAMPNIKDRDEFPYMICVQKELMRYRPFSNVGIPHMASEDAVVENFLIPKGTILMGSLLALHRDPRFYDSPDEFIPERFMKNLGRMGTLASGKVEDRDIFIFGWGKRICPGIHLAETEIFNFYVRFFSKYTMAPALDKQGNPIPVNLDAFTDQGVVLMPEPFKTRILPRTIA